MVLKGIRLTAFLTLLLTLPVLGEPASHPILAVTPPHPTTLAQGIAPTTQAQTQAITLYQPLQTIQWEGQFMSSRGIAYFAFEPFIAPDVSEFDLELARDDHRKVGRLLARLGLLNYLQDDFDKAVIAYKQSLVSAKETGDDELEGLVLGSLGLIYAEKGFYDADTREYLEDYWAFTRRQGQSRAARQREAVALGNLGNFYFGADLYVQAIEFHQKRLALSRQIQDRAGEAKALGDLSLVFQALGNTSKAIDYQQQQLAIAREVKDLRGQSMALANLGIAYHTLGNYAQATNYQQQRLTLARQTKDLKAEAEALANLAGASYFRGDYNQAIALYDQAWAIAWDTLHDADILYGLRGNQGLAYLQRGDDAKALEMFQQYFTYIASRNNRRGQGVVKNNAAVLRLRSGNLPAAAKELRESIEFWESLRSRLGGNDAYKVSIFETQNAPYQNLQSVLLAQKQPEAALEIAERGRARAFVELLSRRLSSLQPTTASGKPRKQPPPLNTPTLEQMKQTAKMLNATLVEYSILSETFNVQGSLQTHESTLLIWVMQSNGAIALRQVDLKPLWQQQNLTLADLVATSREAIGVRSRGLAVVARNDGARGSNSQRLRQLQALLIAPITDLLPKDPTQQVIFLPQGSLFLVPFAALQDRNGKYLIEHHTLSIAPSIQVLALTRQQKGGGTSSSAPALIVGNPTMPKVMLSPGEPPEQLASLPGAEQEAKAIATLLKTKAITGDAATKATVIQQMQNAKLIHLATHGLLDDFRGLGIPGAIALAPAGKDDGLLTASEILDLKLKADLVVLSACDTGSGRITGDGVIGLSRSLIGAGVPSVVVSLWAVPDAPTASLMTTFYQALPKTGNKAQALRQAMLTTMQQYPNPIDWAAFTLIGEPE